MPNKAKEKEIEYEFEDLRRNDDPIPGSVLDALGVDEDELEDDDDGSEEEEGVETDLEDDGEYDPVKMTGAMRKRLARQRREHQRQLDAVRKEGDTRLSKLETELAEMKQGATREKEDTELDDAKGEIQKEIEDAMELGDSAKVAELTTKLADIAAEASLKRHQAAQATHDEPDDLDDDPGQKLKPKAQAWVNDQDDWWDDPEFLNVRNFVIKVDKKLQTAGYSPDDDDFYTELEKVVDKKFPEVINLTSDRYEDDDDETDDDDDIEIAPKTKRRTRRRAKSPVNQGGRRSGLRS